MRRISVLTVFLVFAHAALAETALLNPNLATTSELAGLGHVDSALAESIEANRPYLAATDLDGVLAESLSTDQRGDVYGALFRPINLNTASEAEIMLIPGMSKRMAHEFEEYRPYESIEQFRREIGKYVDDEEVARLEQYVFIPVSLNSASREQIMTIPGMSKRMAHEFEEYRPYGDIEQFRREIGKYVDAEEVARLESYVTLD
ncbi:MAG: helix-hairpin-helix domain-containing protein [Woeseiaceae bacterium]|nr:helix-hairpin-helix domain-containing protein [Woeseiaceae bacterium]